MTFDGNSADSGAAFAVTAGSLTFEKPDVVRFRNGEAFDDQYSVRATNKGFHSGVAALALDNGSRAFYSIASF